MEMIIIPYSWWETLCFVCSALSYDSNQSRNESVNDQIAFLDALQLQGITNNSGDLDPASLAENERKLSERILQLQKFRELLLSQMEQVSVKTALIFVLF